MSGGVHPIAALFPMMPEDDLAALVDDIKENGLRQPLMIDASGQLLDGRNRMKACELAGVEPRFETYDGDPVALIWSLNDRRRHMSKGARAMVAAMADPNGHQGERETSFPRKEVSETSISKARAVLRYAPDLAAQVRDDLLSLNVAYEEAQTARKASESTDALMATLRKRAPDLAELVDSDRMTPPEAMAALTERERRERAHRRNLFAGIGKAIYLIDIIRGEKNREHLVAALRQYPEEFEAEEKASIDALINACSELPKELSAFRQALKRRSKRNGA